MNTALALLAHALRMLIFEVGTTMRVLSPAILLVVGCSLAIGFLAPDAVELFNAVPGESIALTPSSALTFVLFGVIGLFGYALMAILWHRHVLLNGEDGGLRPGASLVLSYLWRAIVVGCVQLLAAIPVTLVVGVLGAAFMQTGAGGAVTSLLTLGGSVIFIWIALRLSVVLPAAALGYRMAVRESWNVTQSLSAPLWGLAVLLTGLNMLVSLLALGLVPTQGVIALMLGTVIFIVEGLIFVSVLTTLYGHLVEGRSLGQ